jgi:hypothetical protein
LYNIEDKLLSLNCKPILVFQETDQLVENFFNSEIKKKYSNILRISNGREIQKLFQADRHLKLNQFITSLPNLVSEVKKLEKKLNDKNLPHKEFEKNTQLQACFLIFNYKIINQHFVVPAKNSDFLRLLIDPNDKNAIKINLSVFECEMPKKKSFLNNNNVDKKNSSMNLKKKINELKSKYTLKDIIYIEKYRSFFKLYLIKEYSYENLLFIEETEKYYNLTDLIEKKKRLLQFKNYFIDKNSPFELNLTNKDFEYFLKNYENDDIPNDIFNSLISKCELNLCDNYHRFFNSDLFDQMVNGISNYTVKY